MLTEICAGADDVELRSAAAKTGKANNFHERI